MTTKLTRPFANSRGRCFDGASKMSVVRQDVKARVFQVHSNVAYVDCRSRVLNLCVAYSCDAG